jgi:2-dehydropantoate 2-reductase
MTVSRPLNVLTIGAGAVGTYIGGSLALHDHAVTFLERPEAGQSLKQRGLRLNLGGQEYHLPNPQVVASLEDALEHGPFNVALYALKSFDTPNAIQELQPYADELPPFLCLSNGVDNETALAEVLGADKVIAGTLTSAIGRRDVGDITLERLRGIGIASGHPLSERLCAAMNAAGLRAKLYHQATDMKWSKLLTNLISNATSAILDMPPAEVFAYPGLYRLEITQLRETLAVMAAQGLQVIDLPGTPVRLLAFAVRSLPLMISRPLIARAVGGGRGVKMPSFHIDLHNGRGQSEVGYLNGAVVRTGERLGVPTPVNRMLTDILMKLTRGELAVEEFAKKPEKLVEWLMDNG